MNQAVELAAYLHREIPLTRAMQVGVVRAGGSEVVLAAPLAPNVNHRRTVFGGSAASLATLACWGLLHTRLRQADIDARLVVQRSTMEYLAPIAGDFEAACRFADDDSWGRLLAAYERRGRARLSLRSTLRIAAGSRSHTGGETMARFDGDFVVVADRD
ncbi:MAG: YiiD C-terminal domain-containing protein [Pseudomonadota bacterium]